ncbi:MAG: AraC family transcriptional regulator, partial [Myxococcales bacterium]
MSEFLEAPVGRYLAGESFLCWCRDPGLFGCIYWGEITRDVAERVVEALDAELHPALTSHASLADMRRMTRVSPEAFEVLAPYLASRREKLERSIRRQALLRPNGLIGSLVAGFY